MQHSGLSDADRADIAIKTMIENPDISKFTIKEMLNYKRKKLKAQRWIQETKGEN